MIVSSSFEYAFRLYSLKMKRFLVPVKPFCNPPKTEDNEEAQSSVETAVKKPRYAASGSENTGDQSSCSEGNKNVKQHNPHPPYRNVNKHDDGNFIGIRLSESQRLDLLTNAWVPPKNYFFPLLQKFETRKLKFLDSGPTAVLIELKMWKKYLIRKGDIKPNNSLKALDDCPEENFPNINMLLRILATLPVSTSTAERTFSSLKRIKTIQRNTIKEDRLNGLAALAMHRDIGITADEVIDELAKKSRKLEFLLR